METFSLAGSAAPEGSNWSSLPASTVAEGDVGASATGVIVTECVPTLVSSVSEPSVERAITSTLAVPEKWLAIDNSNSNLPVFSWPDATSNDTTLCPSYPDRFVTTVPVTALPELGTNVAPATSLGSFKIIDNCSEPSVSVKSASTRIFAVLPEPTAASSTPLETSTLEEDALGASAIGVIFKSKLFASILSASNTFWLAPVDNVALSVVITFT